MTDRRQMLRIGALATGMGLAAPVLGATAASATPSTLSGGHDRRRRPLVIGHRGASGYRPEHTLESYELAARMGADFIEPDLVLTGDGVLVARHENEISGTTDVAARPEFASRRRRKTVDGFAVTGWFTEDFTLAELKTLYAVERLPQLRQHNTLYNGRFRIPTLHEVLQLRARLSRELDREIGVYPETKHPTYFSSIGLPLEEPLVALLRRHGLDRSSAPVFVQSFEAANLRRLRDQFRLRAPLVFLTGGAGGPFGDTRTYADYLGPTGLRDLARFVDGIGPEKNQVIPRLADGTLGTPSTLVSAAHAAGLLVHPYTFRAENQFLPVNLRTSTVPTEYGRAIDEQVAYLRAGVDGLFTDQPDVGVVARTQAFA
jgi:glycerophosphoryl diester phosphodiesterase